MGKQRSTRRHFWTPQAWQRLLNTRKSYHFYTQGDAAKNVMYSTRRREISVVNGVGKGKQLLQFWAPEISSAKDVSRRSRSIGAATSLPDNRPFVIEKKEMTRILHTEHEFSDRFITRTCSPGTFAVEADLVDQLFNSTEKRLARGSLLLLARYGKEGQTEKHLPKISQETLADTIGTTRSRVNLFMNKFKRLGFIKYNGGLQVNNSLLSVVLHD